MLSSWKSEPSNSTTATAAHDDSASRSPAAAASPPLRASTMGDGKTAHSIVDGSLTMRGDLESEGDILVRGKVIGNITCKLLIVDSTAFIDGGVEATEVVVRGHVKGIIKTQRVRLEKSAIVDADVYQSSFSAEEGARIRGSLRSLDESPKSKTADVAKKSDAPVKAVAAE